MIIYFPVAKKPKNRERMSKSRILIIAGEISGDLQASLLVENLQQIAPQLEFIGVGGRKMEAAGVKMLAYTMHMGTVGFTEGFKFYPAFWKIKSKISQFLRRNPPDLIILVDCRDFNLRIAALAKKLGIPTAYYIAPPVWAWPDWRAKWIAREVTKIIAIFPFEAEVYKKAGANVSFVGYPLVDLIKPTLKKEEIYQKFNLAKKKPVIGLLPGSRGHEINAHLPLMIQAAEIVYQKRNEPQFYVPVADPAFKKRISYLVSKSKIPIRIVDNGLYDLMSISRLIVTASGTVTLEASFLKTPMIVVYKLSLPTWMMGKIIVKLPYISLPNIISGRQIVPELIQFQFTPISLARKVLEFLLDEQKLREMKKQLDEVTQKLGSPGAVQRAAGVIKEMMDSHYSSVNKDCQ